MTKFIYTDTNTEVKVGDVIFLLETYPYEILQGVVQKITEKRMTVKIGTVGEYIKYVQTTYGKYNVFSQMIKAKAYYIRHYMTKTSDDYVSLVAELNDKKYLNIFSTY